MRRALRTAFTLLLVVCVSLLLCEAVVRAYFAVLVGPRLLLYGTPWHRDQLASSVTAAAREQNLLQVHRNDVGGYRSYAGGDTGAYSKYFPHEAKVGLGPGGERFDVRINNHGFRGADFDIAKPQGVVRVVTLGASSTFGYSNRDDETYPHRLEQILNERGGGRRFEVINLGVPHATSHNVLALLRAEALALDPDWVTFYEGANDSAMVPPATDPLGKAWEAVRARSVLAEFLTAVLPIAPGGDAEIWSVEFAQRRTHEFLENLEAIADATRAAGARFLVITQQIKSRTIEPQALRGVTYAEEVERVRASLAAGEIGPGKHGPALDSGSRLARILDTSRILLIHDRLVAEEIRWAKENGVPVADARAALDERRDLLSSWVHLLPEANEIVAEVVADVILAELPVLEHGSGVTSPPGFRAGDRS